VYSREEAEEDLIPAYYREAGLNQHHLWVKLRNFTPVEREELLRLLDPERESKRGRPIALGNQTNPLLVRMRTAPRVWWVNQGASFDRATAGGYLWAPAKRKDGGAPFEHWRSMRQLRVGDLVLNYRNGQVRGMSEVTGEARPSPRPDPDADQAWSDEGLRAEVDYRELVPPIPLAEIPHDWRRQEEGPFAQPGNVKQGYLFPLSDTFVNKLAQKFTQLQLPTGGSGNGKLTQPDDVEPASYVEPALETIISAIAEQGLVMSAETIRRYHVSLKTRGFVVLAGVSGTGKTWLAEAYAKAVGAESLIVPVAPNWTTNEDLLGYLNPLDQLYHDTAFSLFLRRAADDWEMARAAAVEARPFHLILDEMNLARVEYYFAKFLSAMEVRARSESGSAPVELAPGHAVALPPNLRFIGTVNVDETTHGFADKVYDRSQLVELEIDHAAILAHLEGRPYRDALAEAWLAFRAVAPFAFRVLDEIASYVDQATALGVTWEAALDEQLLQKVLPKLKGTDLRIQPALVRFTDITAERMPLSHAKATTMLQAFNEHGFTSYF
jgi:MoxR-like ATPase